MSSTINERFATLSHGRTRYLESGEGPPVLLLHGAGFIPGADAWRVTIPALATRYRVIAPDALGWGPGDQLDLDYSFGYMVDSLREMQDALGLERTHVVGHSMGGWLASLLAYESPERVDSLVLVASGGLLAGLMAFGVGEVIYNVIPAERVSQKIRMSNIEVMAPSQETENMAATK